MHISNLAPPPPPKEVIVNPCVPSPCGPNSQCRDIGGSPSCSCLPQYIGSPPTCRPECTINPDCPSNLACIREKCIDPCPGSCGTNALCAVVNHNPSCSCLSGFTGDPFYLCSPQLPLRKFTLNVLNSFMLHKKNILAVIPPNPCNPSPCGPNAVCNNGICTCLPEYQGDPYRECRPECVLNSDCPRNRACVRNKCVDPCPGTCGQNTDCSVINHIPSCTCIEGYVGDPFVLCRKIERKLFLTNATGKDITNCTFL